MDLAVHHTICEGLCGEHDRIGGLAAQCKGCEARTVSLQGLAAVLLYTVELHETLDEVWPARESICQKAGTGK